MTWPTHLLELLDLALLGWIAWMEKRALTLDKERLEIEKQTLVFYSDFVASRTNWYAARGKRPPKDTNVPPKSDGRELVLLTGEDPGEREGNELWQDDSGQQGAGAGDPIEVGESRKQQNS